MRNLKYEKNDCKRVPGGRNVYVVILTCVICIVGTAANAAYKEKDFATAASLYRSLIESKKSKEPKLLKNFAMASLKLESFDVAKKYFDLALSNCKTTEV